MTELYEIPDLVALERDRVMTGSVPVVRRARGVVYPYEPHVWICC